MSQEITIKISEGLCNRLRTIYPFAQYCEENNYKLNVIWPINKYCSSSYNSIFDRHNSINFIDEKDSKCIDFCGFGPPEYLLKLLNDHNYYRFFNPKDSIKDQIKYFFKRINIAYNAVHIRRTDHTNLAKNKKVFTDDLTFVKFIEQSAYPVYLATDCSITQTRFSQHFGSKVFVYKPIKQNNKLRQTSLEHSIIDIIICSMSNEFLGSGYSSFSGFISYLKKYQNNIPFYTNFYD